MSLHCRQRANCLLLALTVCAGVGPPLAGCAGNGGLGKISGRNPRHELASKQNELHPVSDQYSTSSTAPAAAAIASSPLGPVLQAPPALQKLVDIVRPKPRNDRDWVPELKELAQAEFQDNQVKIHNVRNAEFYTYHDCVVRYYDKTYDLTKIKTVDFIVIPFNNNKSIAHTMLSFGFSDGEQVGISAEVRLEKGQQYNVALGLAGQFELIYVIADERDLIRARTEHRNVDVYLYRTTATPDQARKLFVNMLQRANQLRDTPEFYDTLRNNCTTNIVRHIDAIAPGRVPLYDYRVILPGYSAELAYELGLIDNSLPFAEVTRRARINEAALKYRDDPHFSARIRGEKAIR